jgi:hypothetical protein
MSIKPKLYDSFGYLLVMLKRGEWHGDMSHHVYHFGTMLEGINHPETRYAQNYGVSQDAIDRLLVELKVAESEGRLLWRQNEYLRHESEKERFQATLATLRRLGADIPEYQPTGPYPDCYWNIPAMREFLGDRVEYANRI